MSKFSITAKDLSGQSQTSLVEAPDLDSAVRQIQARGLFIVHAVPASAARDGKASLSAGSFKRKFTRKSVCLQDVLSFAKQLSAMLESGVPLLRSLTIIAAQVESQRFAEALDKVKEDVEHGQSFSRALSKHPKTFSQFWVSLVEVGEASGTLPLVLQKLTAYMEQSAAFQSQIVGALIYPAVLFFICVCAVFFFAIFVGPTFEKIFKDMGATLPGITVAMLGIFNFLKTKFLWIAVSLAGAFFLLRKYIQTTRGRRQYERLLFHLPVVGPMIQLVIVEKFASQMSILTATGVPILYALEISERLVDNLVCADVIRDIRESVKDGSLLSDPMERGAFFPPMAIQMIRVGEETGELGKMLDHVARYYKTTVEDFLKRFGTLIEPFMLVFMGAVIGVIVISMFLPLFDISSGGGKI